jgi:hypothetical protein
LTSTSATAALKDPLPVFANFNASAENSGVVTSERGASDQSSFFAGEIQTNILSLSFAPLT